VKGLTTRRGRAIDNELPQSGAPADSTPRRRALMLGAVGAAAVLTIRPALAQTHASVMTCEIPVPDAGHRGGFIAADGSTVPSGTPGAFAPPGAALKGNDVRAAMANGGSLPGVDGERSRAYLNYVRRLQRGTSGFTCFASLQMPRG
jgi:hypothetical protein